MPFYINSLFYYSLPPLPFFFFFFFWGVGVALIIFSSGLVDNLYLSSCFQRQEPFCTAVEKNADEGSEEKQKISVTFVDKDGEEKHIKVPVGTSMLEAAHENDVELEGACEGSLACSTCHVIVMDVDYYNKLEDPTDEENDMLDLAFGLSETYVLCLFLFLFFQGSKPFHDFLASSVT
ncbi:adrenodoxin 2, mitochondrial isoform X1 [Olea europaea subsp. europaea]|uniref:Adrenodoxin 2, mitochondrial isoform X1 n=1 Tax=Olea europaea subsp. europaea TaxID=158383 RepID=A0A8S0SKT4_OLEEU|nr:adrenodoxin 2, mitochondrial isoform X1 [Olea europaea subsp. europaea]